MFVFFWLFWIAVNGRATPDVLLSGAVLSAVVYLFCHQFLGYSFRKELALLRNLGKVQKYAGVLIREVVLSSAAVIRRVYGRSREVKPRLVTFRSPLSGTLKSVLADSITLTPGTITVSSEEDTLTVHCLDTDFAEGIEDTPFQRLLTGAAEEGQHD